VRARVWCAAKLLGFEDFIPPFAGASSDQLLTGVNFASAAAGIREETGQQLGARISFSGQVQNYQSAVQQLVSILGDEDTAAAHLSQCIFTVGMGSNDYLNNYFMPAFYNTGSQYTPEQYADDLAARYAQLLRAMYSNGARKVALVGVGQVGCSPNELAQQSANGVTCVERINSAIRIFNQELVGLVDQFNTLPGAHFTYINIYGIFDDILGAPGSHGRTDQYTSKAHNQNRFTAYTQGFEFSVRNFGPHRQAQIYPETFRFFKNIYEFGKLLFKFSQKYVKISNNFMQKHQNSKKFQILATTEFQWLPKSQTVTD
jgi:hypothetical protein